MRRITSTHHRPTTSVGAVALLALGGVGLAAPATAAPPEPETVSLHCDDGVHREVVVSGRGLFTPGRVVDTGAVLVPLAFHDGSFTAELPDGTVVTESFPTEEKGGGAVLAHTPRPVVTCDYEVAFVLEVEEMGFPAGTSVTLTESVSGMLVGRR